MAEDVPSPINLQDMKTEREWAALYMSVAEQREALLSAGFVTVEQVLLKSGLVLHDAAL